MKKQFSIIALQLLTSFILPVLLKAQDTAVLNVTIVSDEAEAVINILNKKVLNQEVSPSDWQAVFSSEGYIRLQKRERSLKRSFEDSTFKQFVLADSTVKMHKALSETLQRWKSANMSEVAAYAFAYLPAGARIRAKVYPVIKPRSNNFVFEYPDDPAIFLYLDPNASKKRFETILAHELHHIGFGGGCASEAEKQKTKRLSDNTKNVLNWLGSLGEGFATLAAAGTPDINPYEEIFPQEISNWNNDILNYNANLKTLEKFFLDLADGNLSKEQINETGFSFFGVPGRSGLWYVIGWQMGVVIEKIDGRKKLVEVICNRSKLLSTYNKAVRKYNKRYHVNLAEWSEELIKKL